jgi:tRNA-dihydrouridine synthase B
MMSQIPPLLALATMQDVTDAPFWALVAARGGADVYFTEYFRVHRDSRPEKHILRSINDNPTGRPVVAQLIGNDVAALVRTARELQQYPIAAIDLNLGCPASTVYRKHVGGGLLRDPHHVDIILGALRDAVRIKFTVKTRLGFSCAAEWDELLPVFMKHPLDMLTVHGRTVMQLYRGEVRYDLIAAAAAAMPCAVLANGDITSARQAADVLAFTGARGLMIGRGAIRNPWLFEQIRRQLCGQPVILPRARDVLDYVRQLHEIVSMNLKRETPRVHAMKKYLNFLAPGVEPTGRFLRDIRHVKTEADFFHVCESFLGGNEPMALDPAAPVTGLQ